MKFTNGALVHQRWGDLPDADLLATFQYDSQAIMFCKAYVERMNEGCILIVTDTGQGKQYFFEKPKPQAEGK
jgi:hypothetical protein